MTEKELKKLNRQQLLELLIIQTERCDKLQNQLEKTASKLTEEEIKISSMGSVAEAALALGGVFEAAQKAADLYLLNAQKRADAIVAHAEEEAAKIIAEAKGEDLENLLREVNEDILG